MGALLSCLSAGVWRRLWDFFFDGFSLYAFFGEEVAEGVSSWGSVADGSTLLCERASHVVARAMTSAPEQVLQSIGSLAPSKPKRLA